MENKDITNDTKKTVDFNNPEEKKAYFDNLHKEYKNLEYGSKEYEDWMTRNFCSKYKNLSDEEKVVYDIIVRDKNNYLDFEDDFKKDNPNATDKEIQEAYLKANPDIDKEKFYKKREAYELAAEIECYKIQGNQTKVDELSEDFKKILETGIVTQEEIQEELDKKLKNTKKDNPKEDAVFPGIEEDENKVYNSIMIGSGVGNDTIEKKELKQEDYVYNVEEKETLWDKIKNRFSKIKDGILNVINSNRKSKELNGVKSIDIAENNTPSKLDYVKVDLSQEEQRDNIAEFKNSIKEEKNSIKEEKNSSIEVDRGNSFDL